MRHVAAFSDVAHAEVADPIDVLYIDGAHRYAPARADIRSWGNRVADGGTLLIHDSFSSVGVTLAILRELVPGRRFRYVGRSRSLTEYRADLPVERRRAHRATASPSCPAAVVRAQPRPQGRPHRSGTAAWPAGSAARSRSGRTDPSRCSSGALDDPHAGQAGRPAVAPLADERRRAVDRRARARARGAR